MAISFPITLPTSPAPSRQRLGASAVVGMTSSPTTLEAQVQVHPGQGWAMDLELPAMTRAQAASWVAALVSLNGREGTFHFGDIAGGAPRGTVLGTPLVDGAAQADGTLDTKGWMANSTGVLLPMDYIEIGSGATRRLYLNLTQADADGSGLATLDVWPDVRDAPADAAAITTSICMGTFRLAENIQAWDVGEAQFYGLDFSAVEAI